MLLSSASIFTKVYWILKIWASWFGFHAVNTPSIFLIRFTLRYAMIKRSIKGSKFQYAFYLRIIRFTVYECMVQAIASMLLHCHFDDDNHKWHRFASNKRKKRHWEHFLLQKLVDYCNKFKCIVTVKRRERKTVQIVQPTHCNR